ncbi:c-type cytochrome [Swingsia samuiensis]|uniref:Cytochrome c n=1 Tax=Swingsia samuiensis TaxID=1293412 RepID=A0A4Y6UGT6_9PROT|nr:cytochrome c [Swingsia samuiensis]QDH16763.1 cytochrome c [Swingsia samuiensis]
MKYIFKRGLMAVLLGSCGMMGVSSYAQPTAPVPESAKHPSISRGHYLAIAADCAACHTNNKDGQFLAGGYAIASPMGNIYSTNITPSKKYGIGNYTLEQFTRVLREGVRADGSNLYPAMPYDAYSQLTDADIKSLYAYIMHEVPAVDEAAPQTKLPFPFSIRASLGVWKLIARNRDTPYVFDHSQSDDWNRGRYLVDQLAHCGECHTPRNFFLVSKQSQYLAGSDVGSWRAPNITSDPISGIGGWSDDDLFEYLKTGKIAHARAAGPMAEAVQHSLQYLPDRDISAMITFLRSVPPIRSSADTAANFNHGGHPSGYAVLSAFDRRANSTIDGVTDGAVLYEESCASCHQSNGRGTPDGQYPSLVGNTTTGQSDPTDLVASILYGVDRTVATHETLMPAFGAHALVQPLNDVQVASVADYVLSHFGNTRALVTPEFVHQIRTGGKPVAIAQLGRPSVMMSMAVAGIVLIILVIFGVRRLFRARRSL